MKKLSIYLILVIHSAPALLYSMDIKNTQISPIKEAAYYFHKTWQAGEKTLPELKYYNNKGRYVGRLNSDQYKAGNTAVFDGLIDSTSPSINIKYVDIVFDPLMGRTLHYLNKEEKPISLDQTCLNQEDTFACLSHFYQGPIDIKKSKSDISWPFLAKIKRNI